MQRLAAARKHRRMWLLFSDAKAAENHVEQFFGIHAAHDIADGVHRVAQFLGDEFRR